MTAVDELLAEHWPLVPWLYRYRRPKLDEADALSFGYEALWIAAASYDAARCERFAPFATVCVARRWLQESQSATERRRRRLRPLPDGFEPCSSDGGRVAERVDHVRRAAASLDPFDQQIVAGRLGGETFAEIAARLGVSRSRVGARFARFLPILRRRVQVLEKMG